MAKRKQEWHGRCEFPLTEAYEQGHVSTFGEKADRHCNGCGRLPAWCECGKVTLSPRFVGQLIRPMREGDTEFRPCSATKNVRAR